MTDESAIDFCTAVAGLSFSLLIFCIIDIFKTIKDLKCQEKKRPPNGSK